MFNSVELWVFLYVPVDLNRIYPCLLGRGPVFLDDGFLVHLAHCVAFDVVDELEHRGDLVGCHFLLELCAEVLELERFGLVG